MVGKVEGDSFKVKVEPAQGYGEFKPDLVKIVDKDTFEGTESIKEGMAFETQDPDGGTQHIVVKKVDGDKVTVDGNHPLAGTVLHFEIEIVSVREATPEEIDHGHAHDGHSHHH